MSKQKLLELLAAVLQANQGNRLTIETINGILLSIEQHLPPDPAPVVTASEDKKP
jgi:hypothetical protein